MLWPKASPLDLCFVFVPGPSFSIFKCGLNCTTWLAMDFQSILKPHYPPLPFIRFACLSFFHLRSHSIYFELSLLSSALPLTHQLPLHFLLTLDHLHFPNACQSPHSQPLSSQPAWLFTAAILRIFLIPHTSTAISPFTKSLPFWNPTLLSLLRCKI